MTGGEAARIAGGCEPCDPANRKYLNDVNVTTACFLAEDGREGNTVQYGQFFVFQELLNKEEGTDNVLYNQLVPDEIFLLRFHRAEKKAEYFATLARKTTFYHLCSNQHHTGVLVIDPEMLDANGGTRKPVFVFFDFLFPQTDKNLLILKNMKR